jgi:phosphoribosyl-ATP pyrophosphohydrolase
VSCVPDEDMEVILNKLNRNNVQEVAQEIADLAHWFN